MAHTSNLRPRGTPPGTRKEIERRRLKGARLLQRGVTLAEVARRLGVSRTSATRWSRRLKNDTIRLRKATGRHARLTMEQCAEVYRTASEWTGEAFAAAIWERFRVKFHRDHAGRKLKILRRQKRAMTA